MTVTISKVVTRADLEALVESVAALFVEDGGRHDEVMDTQWPAREGLDYYGGLAGDQACLLAMAHDDERPVGHLVGKLLEPAALRTARFAVLESMRVAPQHRRLGIGKQLVAQFLAWARDHHAERASVTAFAGNTGAQRFYARHGFAPHAVTMRSPLR